MRYVILFLLLGVAGIGGSGLLYSCTSTPSLIQADTAVTAADLSAAFDSNEYHSDSLYLNKVLLVKGVIRRVRRNESGGYTAVLGDMQPSHTTVDCRLDSQYNQRPPTLQKGDSVNLLGICAGRLQNVLMVQCIIKK